MYRLYDYKTSGNGYKVALLLTQLKQLFAYVETDILAGETHTPEFLAKNPNGKVPVLETPEGDLLSESNAILAWLAEGTPFLPSDRMGRYQVLQWMFWEQYSHEPYIATSRFWLHHPDAESFYAKLNERRPGGLKALKLMEDHLSRHDFLVAESYTIADIALYAYTHVAPEGCFPLDDYPAVRAWLERVRNQPNHITIQEKVQAS
ncbi:MAG: glutathione S-transferase family protein [Acidobacteriota bacterium]|nr:glutathione S-transferase family protein [Acidobacteriota bacterium]